MTSSPVVAPRGAQRPRILWTPPNPGGSSAAGQEAVELAAYAGLQLDPWQQFVLQSALAETPEGRWAAFEVGLVVARQNGKGGVLEARELFGLFLAGERLILHSAHQFDTALEAFLRLLELIENTPDLDARVRRVSRAHGEEGIELKTGQRLRFKARTSRSGRGFTGDTVILDEAMYLPSGVMSALMPTVSARPNPQLWYVGSAVDAEEHEHGHTLASVRERALAGDDPSLCYLEWSPAVERPEDVDPRDERLWEQANPGLGIRITREHVAKEQRSMLRRSFAVERLSVGDWPAPVEQEHVVDLAAWRASATDRRSSQLVDPVAFAVDMTPNRARTAIVVAGRRADGRWQGEVIEDVEMGSRRGGRLVDSEWVLDRVEGLIRKWDPCALMIHPLGAAGSLEAELQERGFDPVSTTSRELAQACGLFYDAVTGDQFRHLDDPRLNDAVAGAGKRDLGGGAWSWDWRSRVPVHTLVALTLAIRGVAVHGRPKRPPAAPQSVAPVGTAVSETSDLARMGF